MPELVVLVDDSDTPIGTADKAVVHTKNTPLHRGFSLFVFNDNEQLLVTRRADNKKTFPGVWTNTVCGHPAPDERVEDAAMRRLRDELGISGISVQVVAPYRYRFADKSGIVEHEICPVLIGYYNGDPRPDPKEAGSWKWMDWKEFLSDIKVHPDVYSPWSRQEAELLVRQKLPQTDRAQQ